jgi:hypothetical protein
MVTSSMVTPTVQMITWSSPEDRKRETLLTWSTHEIGFVAKCLDIARPKLQEQDAMPGSEQLRLSLNPSSSEWWQTPTRALMWPTRLIRLIVDLIYCIVNNHALVLVNNALYFAVVGRQTFFIIFMSWAKQRKNHRWLKIARIFQFQTFVHFYYTFFL